MTRCQRAYDEVVRDFGRQVRPSDGLFSVTSIGSPLSDVVVEVVSCEGRQCVPNTVPEKMVTSVPVLSTWGAFNSLVGFNTSVSSKGTHLG